MTADDHLVRETLKVDNMDSAAYGFVSKEFTGISIHHSSQNNSNQFANVVDKNIKISHSSSVKGSSEKHLPMKSISEHELMQKSNPMIVMDHKCTLSTETEKDP